jgi:hypothetical protein
MFKAAIVYKSLILIVFLCNVLIISSISLAVILKYLLSKTLTFNIFLILIGTIHV